LTLTRLLVALPSLALGAAIALFTVALHGYGWGLALGLVTTAACLVALPGGWARMPFGIGWAALVGVAVPTRPEGDLVITQDAAGWVLLAAAAVVLVCSMIGARDHTAHRADPAPVVPPGEGPADSR